MKEKLVFWLGTILYLAYLYIVFFVSELLPNTMRKHPQNTADYFQIPKIIAWFTSIVSGFAYCNTISLGKPYKSCFKSRHDRYIDLIVVLIYSSIVCIFTANVVIFSDLDYRTTHYEDPYNSDGIYTHSRVNMAVVKTNFYFFCIPFTLFLNFFHVRKIKFLSRLIINTENMKTWGKGEWIFFTTLLSALVSFFVLSFYLYYTTYGATVLLYYFIYLGLIVIVIWFVSYVLRDTHFLHLHHYFITMLVLPFLCVQNKLYLIFLGCGTGLMVEGSAKWGIDAVWRKHHSRTE